MTSSISISASALAPGLWCCDNGFAGRAFIKGRISGLFYSNDTAKFAVFFDFIAFEREPKFGSPPLALYFTYVGRFSCV